MSEKDIELAATVNAAKETISGEDVWNCVSQAKRIVVAQNKKIMEFDPKKDGREDIVAAVAGRTGNLRAPTLKIGSTMYVGFNEELYEKIVSGL